jgi:hypothetical protein
MALVEQDCAAAEPTANAEIKRANAIFFIKSIPVGQLNDSILLLLCDSG